MNSKDLIRSQMSEAGERPPGAPGGQPRPSGPRRNFSAGVGMAGMPDESGSMGGIERTSMRPRGPFSPQEMSMVKDLLLLAATEVMGNDFDGQIARKLMKGDVPSSGDLQHIVDEVRRVRDLPEPHQKLLQKIIGHINSAQSAGETGELPA